MGGKSSRTKGAAGEREFIKLLKKAVPGVEIKRNLQQSAEGGYDIIGLEMFAIEVKRQESLSVAAWWSQAVSQATVGQVPVLAFRQSRKPWRVLTSGWLNAGKAIAYCRVEISLDDFFRLVRDYVEGGAK